ncbi:hypothetical protein MSTE_04723 [Mycobacteroides stephanolepidis]|uniref:Uncharacterized protein n=1 Tax=[Mycobacterium] stephanolepidis TaxID=1520670 RepID=A0A1Z4F491_9MYCO|nr:hypothetical protein MSTE_04723 [[Mycobacterium] stephanolepidis]
MAILPGAVHGRAAADCSRRRWWNRSPRRPPGLSIAAPHAAPAPRAVWRADAAMRRQTPDVPTPVNPRCWPGLSHRRAAVRATGSRCARPTRRAGRRWVLPARWATGGAACPPAPSDRCWWLSGRARCAPTTCPRTVRRPSSRAGKSPAPGPRHRGWSPSFGSSGPEFRADIVRCAKEIHPRWLVPSRGRQ